MHFIIKYFPEITIKSSSVRKRFATQLQRNLRNLLKPVCPDIVVHKGWDRLDITSEAATETQTAQVMDRLATTPGIAYFAEVIPVEFSDLEALGYKVLDVWKDRLADKSFCVRVKRNGKQTFKSTDVERVVGSVLNRNCETASVKLKNPDIEIKLEVVDQHCFIVRSQINGLGGFPLGTQDPVLSLVSGGFDSTVASYLTNRRGLLTHFCFFNLGGQAHELGVKEVSYYLWKKYGSSHHVKFISIPFEEVVSEILQKIHHSQMGVVLKRMMFRVATQVAEELKIKALVTGESVAQVASQTLQNLSVIDRVTDTLVLRPLITMDKGDIINLSREIGTEDYAASMPEYCGVISVKPTTSAIEEKVIAEEENFDWKILEKAFEQKRVENILDVAKNIPTTQTLLVTDELDSNDVVIDIRHPDEAERRPLVINQATIKTIPFYQLNSKITQLPNTCRYLLYCDKGIMSQLHAGHLVAEGYTHFGVYRPREK